MQGEWSITLATPTTGHTYFTPLFYSLVIVLTFIVHSSLGYTVALPSSM